MNFAGCAPVFGFLCSRQIDLGQLKDLTLESFQFGFKMKEPFQSSHVYKFHVLSPLFGTLWLLMGFLFSSFLLSSSLYGPYCPLLIYFCTSHFSCYDCSFTVQFYY